MLEAPPTVRDAVLGRLTQLREYRQRYSKQEYPRKVAINLVYEALANQELLKEKQAFFPGRLFPTLPQAAQAGGMRREQHRQAVIHRVDQTLDNGRSVGNLQVDAMRETVRKAQSGDNAAVELLEFSFVYYTAMYDCIWSWAVVGLTGSDMMQASGSITGMFFGPPNFNDNSQIEKMFYSATNAFVEDLYTRLPPLW